MTSESRRIITIHSDTIELNQLLKFEGLAYSGGEAKKVINDGLVSVNGETETPKACPRRIYRIQRRNLSSGRLDGLILNNADACSANAEMGFPAGQ